jgi:Flp pilus assembly protein TadD
LLALGLQFPLKKEILMKKLIGTVSVAMMLGCALALANTDDTSNTTSDSHGTSTADTSGTMSNEQQAGTADMNSADTNTTANDQAAPNKMEDSATTTTTKTTKSAMNKSCVNNNGKTLYKGQTGYHACIKSHKKDQMGGIADDDTDMNTSK